MENLGKENTVVLKTSPSTITAYNGKKTIAKIESHHGKIMSVNLYDNAQKLIYITETGSVVIYSMLTEQSIQISKLDSVDSFINVIKIDNNYMVLCRAINNSLQVNNS
jgi:hypothetical protein